MRATSDRARPRVDMAIPVKSRSLGVSPTLAALRAEVYQEHGGVEHGHEDPLVEVLGATA